MHLNRLKLAIKYGQKKVRKGGGVDNKLDGVGPVDNRPSDNLFNHFVNKQKNLTCDTSHVTPDM